jgi:hypothetical protein
MRIILAIRINANAMRMRIQKSHRIRIRIRIRTFHFFFFSGTAASRHPARFPHSSRIPRVFPTAAVTSTVE